ncbi:hypothetical protein ACJX0J_033227, partial [Zea mays]
MLYKPKSLALSLRTNSKGKKPYAVQIFACAFNQALFFQIYYFCLIECMHCLELWICFALEKRTCVGTIAQDFTAMFYLGDPITVCRVWVFFDGDIIYHKLITI